MKYYLLKIDDDAGIIISSNPKVDIQSEKDISIADAEARIQ